MLALMGETLSTYCIYVATVPKPLKYVATVLKPLKVFITHSSAVVMHQCSALECVTIVVIVVNLITLRQPENKQTHVMHAVYCLHIVYTYPSEAVEVLYHTPIQRIGVRDLLI